MSRTAKYRSWNDFLKVFAYFEDGEYWYDYDGDHYTRGVHAFDWGNAEQYTGLKDKNGVEIYEGDKLKWFNEMGWQHAEIVFKNGAFKAMVSKGYYYDAAILFSMRLGGDIAEIIGNIHTLDTNT